MHNLATNFGKMFGICNRFGKEYTNELGNVSRRGVVPKFSDLEVIALSLTAEALSIDSENLLFSKLTRNSAPFYVIGSISTFCISSAVLRVTSALCHVLLIFTIFTSERNNRKSAGENFLLSSCFLSRFRMT